jgi:hypothetical protein
VVLVLLMLLVMLLIVAAANRRAVEAHVAGAAVLAALAATFAAGLQCIGTLLVAAGAANRATIVGVLALAMAVGERALAALQTVLSAAATAQSVAQHATKILQRAARQFVVTMAMNLATALAFFKLDFTPRHHAPLSAGLTGLRTRLPLVLLVMRGRSNCKPFHDYCARHRKLLSS